MAAKMFKKIFVRKGKKGEKMADSSEANQGSSEEFIDHYCDICYKGKNIKIRAEGYCPECDQYLCKDCLNVHAQLPSTKPHVVRTGKDLPKSQSDEPSRFESSSLSTAESSFPTSSEGSAAGYQPSENREQMKDMNAVKWEEYNISLRDDRKLCGISGLAVTRDGRRLLVDWRNDKIKMFSQDMKIISSLSPPDELPLGIAVTGDREAVVTAWYQLYILDVSDQQLSVRETVRLSFDVWGIAACRDRLVVTSQDRSPSVKLIDQRGKVYWSTSTDQQGQQLFSEPYYVSCYDDGRSSTVIVTDYSSDTLTLLDSDTGEVIRRPKVEGKGPHGVTTDRAGNIYVNYMRTREVAMWTGDLAEGKILLTLPWSKEFPAIVYDSVAEELVVIHDIEDE